MAIRDAQYAGSFTIPAPRGVYQAAGDTNIDARYAYRAENMRTERGLLAACYGTSRAFPSLGAPVETLARFYRRTKPDDPEVFVAAAGGKLYTYTAGAAGWMEAGSGYGSNVWSHVTYEAVENGETVDVLILSNPVDGMVSISGATLKATARVLEIGDDFKTVRFAVLARYGERIWGTGAPGYPDSVFYSRPYDPFTWTADVETPQLGGGVMNQPTWDGDSFIALRPFGGFLLAFKRATAFEIRGTDPSTFTVTQAYGTDGPVQARTICVDRTAAYFLTENGLGVYDGSSLSLLSRDALYETMRMRMTGTDALAAACVSNHVVYMALCVKQSAGDVLTQNNTVVEYDAERGTFMLRTGLRVKDFFALNGQVYFTQADSPYEVMRYGDPDAAGDNGAPVACLWETPWLDLGKDRIKRDFELRFTAETETSDVPVAFTILTEKREKTKTVLLQRGRRDYRVKIQSRGLRVKLRIRSGRKAAGWQIHGGVQVDYSVDEE